MLKYIVPFLILSLCSLFAESSVWRVSKEGQTFYIGGTCHFLRTSDYPIPSEFELAYSLADNLVFEMDPALAIDPKFAMELLKASSYDETRNLETVLSEEVYKELVQICRLNDLTVDIFNNMKPGMVITMLMVKELERFGAAEKGVDLYFYEKAVKDKKEILAFETAEFQIDLIASLGEGSEDAMITCGLEDIENLQKDFDLLIKVWREGDLKKIEKNFVRRIRSFPELYEQLLVARNKNWISYFEALAYVPGAELILVGVAHLAGDDGLIALLEKDGYSVEQLDISF